jgi:hypothetical protein
MEINPSGSYTSKGKNELFADFYGDKWQSRVLSLVYE